MFHSALPMGAGRIVDTAGDGAFAAFPSVDGAASSPIELENLVSRQNATYTREHQLVVRAGLNFGPVLTDGQAVTGDAVNLAARVCASGQPGEIRTTEAAFRELSPQRRLFCHGIGKVALKGVTEPVPLMVLSWRDKTRFAARLRVVENGEELALPAMDTITFGRLREQGGVQANDVVLHLREREKGMLISRWHFELCRHRRGSCCAVSPISRPRWTARWCSAARRFRCPGGQVLKEATRMALSSRSLQLHLGRVNCQHLERQRNHRTRTIHLRRAILPTLRCLHSLGLRRCIAGLITQPELRPNVHTSETSNDTNLPREPSGLLPGESIRPRLRVLWQTVCLGAPSKR